MVTEVFPSFAQRHDFCMTAGVVIGDVLVPSASDYSSIANYKRAYWHFAHLKRALRCSEGLFHPKFIVYLKAGHNATL